MGDEQKTNDGAKILVIDDEEVVHISLKRILGRQGHHVVTTASGHEALEILVNECFDMVITDLMMPEMNGIELLQELKKRSIASPVLMITGYPTIKTALQALRLGAVDYLAKPFTRAELLSPVNRALRHQATEDCRASVIPPLDDIKAADAHETFALTPGERYRLRRHSWIVYQQDGTVKVGIEDSFLRTIGEVVTLELPEESDLVEQGYVGIRIRTNAGEEHGVLMPLSGRVIALNKSAAEEPEDVDAETWLVRILPDRLQQELSVLVRG